MKKNFNRKGIINQKNKELKDFYSKNSCITSEKITIDLTKILSVFNEETHKKYKVIDQITLMRIDEFSECECKVKFWEYANCLPKKLIDHYLMMKPEEKIKYFDWKLWKRKNKK